jgi:hypothetical protein
VTSEDFYYWNFDMAYVVDAHLALDLNLWYVWFITWHLTEVDFSWCGIYVSWFFVCIEWWRWPCIEYDGTWEFTPHSRVFHLATLWFFWVSFYLFGHWENWAPVPEKPSFLVVVVTTFGSHHWYKITFY